MLMILYNLYKILKINVAREHQTEQEEEYHVQPFF